MTKYLLIILLLVGCNFPLEDEGTLRRKGTSVTLTYTHKPIRDVKYNQYTSAVNADLYPVRHNIKVEPDIEDIDLDENLRAEVEVPVEKPLYVEYTNWTADYPNIYYQYGVSDEFIITHEDPEVVVINIKVDINPDYPFPEEETTDNETEENTEEETEEEVDETLLAHYAFEGNLNDNSSYERHLTEEGTITYSGENFQNNVSGQAAWFDGNVLLYTNEIDMDVIGLTDNFTISFWILPDLSNADFDQWHSVMSSGDSTSGYRFQIDHDGQERLRGFGYLAVDIDAEWMHFTYTKTTNSTTGDNQKIRVYKNAELKTYIYPMQARWDRLKIGMNRAGGGGWYGYIDDFRIYNRPLSATEVEELYESYDP